MLPLVTTRFTVERYTQAGDPYETAAAESVLSAVPGHLSSPSAASARTGGLKQVVDFVAYLPYEADVRGGDVLTDETSGERFAVATVLRRHGLGLDHTVAGVVMVTGAARG